VNRPLQRQSGISLVEIMVALVLSLILTGGAIQVYLSAKQGYRSQEGYSRLQENGRYALEMIASQLRLAGYRAEAWKDSLDTVFPAYTVSPPTDGTGAVFLASQVIWGTETVGTLCPASDCVTVRFQGNADGLIENCLGSNVPAANVMLVTFYRTTDSRLSCKTKNETTGNSPDPQTLIDGVENLQVLYGVDTDSPPDLYANKYRTAPQVTTDSEWNSVVSVKIGLVLNTTQNVSNEADTASFNLLGTNVAAPSPSSANRFMRRHAFSTTINLRNRSP
jgi:type IV pilus assembly protein PilW